MDAQSSATSVRDSDDVCCDSHPLPLSSDQIKNQLHNVGPRVNPDTDSHAAALCTVVDGIQSNENIGVAFKDDASDKANMDMQDLSSLETTVDYSICSDIQDSKVPENCEMQTTIEYYAECATESAADAEKVTFVDVRTEAPVVTSDIQKSVDLLAVPSSVNVDLCNGPKVCSPPTLMVV